jgi:hypothetical protein
MKEALKQVSSLLDRFQRNSEAYRSPAYNETQLRIEFIGPFFEALGWDVANKAGYAEQYKDVVHEDAIKVAGATKAPDYCFRIGGGKTLGQRQLILGGRLFSRRYSPAEILL